MKNRLSFLQHSIFLFIFLFFMSCKTEIPNTEYTTVKIDFEYIHAIDLSDELISKVIPLETTDESLLYEIEAIDFLNDKIFIFNKNNVGVFDKKGHFLYNIGKRGQGPGEFNIITTFFIEGGKIYLFDIITQRLLIYNEQGKFLSSINLKEKGGDYSLIYPINNNNYVVKNRYYSGKEFPTISFLNKEYEKFADVTGYSLSNGEFDLNSFFSSKEGTLYWKFLIDTIYSIEPNKPLIPKYFVDFQEYAIPTGVRKTHTNEQLIEYINDSSNDNIATLIRYVEEDSLCLRFSFIQKEAKINYVRYNKKDNTVDICQFTDSKQVLSPEFFMTYKNGNIIIPANYIYDDESNPSLILLNEDVIFSKDKF